MAQACGLEDLMSNLKISDALPKCDKADCFIRISAAPDCGFKSTIISSIEAELTINDNKHNIKATGLYSKLYVGLMHGKIPKTNKDRCHFGLILQQEVGWCIDNNERKCLLIHHMGNHVEIAIGCYGCCQNTIIKVYGKTIPNPKSKFYYYGISCAAVGRFLGEKSLGRNIKYKYNSEYANGKQFYLWKTSNCLRLVFDMLFFLHLNYNTAINFIINNEGDQKWDQVFKEITQKKENQQFFKALKTMWSNMKSNDDLKKIVRLVDEQYHLDKALLLISLFDAFNA